MHSFWPKLTLAFALLGCAPSDRGMLEPVAGPGVTLVSTHGLPNDTARLTVDGTSMDVTGNWSDQGESIEIVYRAGDAPTAIGIVSTAERNGHVVKASAAWDRSVQQPGNAVGRPLLEQGPLRIERGGSSIVQIEYSRGSDGNAGTIGDTITIGIPTPRGPHPVTFRYAPE